MIVLLLHQPRILEPQPVVLVATDAHRFQTQVGFFPVEGLLVVPQPAQHAG